MTDDSHDRVIQFYKPSGLDLTDHVSVSGLDLSRDRKELLVSYESDQIYTFPVFPDTRYPGASTMDQIRELVAEEEGGGGGDNGDGGAAACAQSSNRSVTRRPALPELAAYGAHLNRFTFLKNAKYAGPRDEYICTGSDSGHAWIYEKSTGAVVSFWKADNSTCNGVIPHPTLPFFLTYGIDSTAKLWRSTVPVDSSVDDSAVGRRRHCRKEEYEMSPTVRGWGEVKAVLNNFDRRESGMEQSEVFPDHIPSTKIVFRRGRLSQTWLRDSPLKDRGGRSKIGNDLHNLPQTLKENLYACLRSLYDDDDVPVESGLEELKHRVSLIRLRHQADRLGLTWSPSLPWVMEGRTTVATKEATLMDAPEDHRVDPADLVPDCPSDWIPYDSHASSDPFDFRNCFNRERYGDFFQDRYRSLDERNALGSFCDDDIQRCVDRNGDDVGDALQGGEQEAGAGDIILQVQNDDFDAGLVARDDKDHDATVKAKDDEDDPMKVGDEKDVLDSKRGSGHEDAANSRVYDVLLETMTTLKEGGNAALKEGNLDLAAHRYDKSIQYAAMFFMRTTLQDLQASMGWNPLLKTLIVTRLNLALLLLKPRFGEAQASANQAKLALEELSPFLGSSGPSKCCAHSETREIMNLASKAYFRLGSAHHDMGDYGNAAESFESSIKTMNLLGDPNVKPDSLVLRRLAEAKRENFKNRARMRKKFKLSFGGGSGVSDTPTVEAAAAVPSTSRLASPSAASASADVGPTSDTVGRTEAPSPAGGPATAISSEDEPSREASPATP
jgi:tetratricopeptide (TPR) repeat protein